MKPKNPLASLNIQTPTKRIAIDKANTQMLIVMAVASVVSVFCLVASNAVLSQNKYQARVLAKKKAANSQLQQNIQAFDSLVSHYKAFDKTPHNVIGGLTDGTGDNDGPNSKIILDSLPPTYDFPALTSSLEKILDDRSLKVTNINGVDDQLTQQNNSSSPTPVPVPIPFDFTVSDSSYASAQELIDALQHSIRPIAIDTLSLTGSVNSMTITVNAHTYYQPAKSLQITKTVVK